jgi:hypothetical protein
LIKKNGVDINGLDVEEWRIAEVFIEKKLIKELARLLFGYRQLHGFSSYGMLLVEWSYSTSALIILVKLKVSQVRLLKNIRC